MSFENETILVTGGAGFIGSHTCVELLNLGYKVVVYDNFSNGHAEALRRVQIISSKKITIVKGDIRDECKVLKVIKENKCNSVIHFAGLKAVGESVNNPEKYYENNVYGTLCVLRAMQKAGVKKIIFSSSATVYGTPQTLPITECHPLSAINPYGRTKLIVEEMLKDFFRADGDWCINILRYFNPIGAHSSGQLGESPFDLPNNLIPYLTQVAIGRIACLNIWGSDYPTVDGTGVRDYIHVVDLAIGHIRALERLIKPQCEAFNLGTGIGTSVLEIVQTFELVTGRNIPYKFSDRRDGDVAVCYASAQKANTYLDWSAVRDLKQMCVDAWRWQELNPRGYT